MHSNSIQDYLAVINRGKAIGVLVIGDCDLELTGIHKWIEN